MRQKPGTRKTQKEKIVKDIRRATRNHYSTEEKIRIVLDGLKSEDSIAEQRRLEGLFQACNVVAPKSFSKPERSGWRGIQHVLVRQAR